MGIEPTSEAWEASILPLYDARSVQDNSTRDSGLRTTAPLQKEVSVPVVAWAIRPTLMLG